MSKYHAKPTSVDGIRFDSKAEARRYQELRLMERTGIISGLERQVKHELLPKYRNGKGQTVRAISYVSDFEYIDNASGRRVIEDVKGQRTAVYKIKKKLFEHRYSPMIITEVTNGK